MSNGITLSEARDNRGVRAVHDESDDKWLWLEVAPYGNCVLLNNLARSSNIRLGNISTVEEGDALKVNVIPVGGE